MYVCVYNLSQDIRPSQGHKDMALLRHCFLCVPHAGSMASRVEEPVNVGEVTPNSMLKTDSYHSAHML